MKTILRRIISFRLNRLIKKRRFLNNKLQQNNITNKEKEKMYIIQSNIIDYFFLLEHLG